MSQMEKNDNTGLLNIPVATHFFRQKYIYAFDTQAEVLHHVRTQALKEEADQLPRILAAWEEQQVQVVMLAQQEGGVAETIRLQPIPGEHHARLEAIADDELLRKTFSQLPTTFELVEIDKLVAPQRTVNLDYIDRLLGRYPKNPTLDELLEICLSPKREMDPIQHLEIAPNTHVFSSPNSDIRFLGAFVKDLKPDDLEWAVMGGLPAAAIIAFVGYGGAPVNVLKVGNRVILNNGFHRVFALRSLGVKMIPVVVQHVRNAQLECPPQVAGLPKEYLLNVPRPVLLKDFFEPDFTVMLRVRERVKMVTVGVGLSQHEVPS
jgi:hypothetical protein